MRKLFFILLLLTTTSCFRRELREIEDTAIITKMHNSRRAMSYSDSGNETTVYLWNEDELGKIWYTKPDTADCFIFCDKKLYDKDVYVFGEYRDITVDLSKQYDFLFVTRSHNTKYDYSGEENYFKAFSTMPLTKSFTYTNEYEVIPQCDEIFGVYRKNLFAEILSKDYYIEYIDGVLTKIYEEDIELTPLSYIYIIQVIIYNDDKVVPMTISSCEYLGVSGLAKTKELFSRKTTNERGVIEIKEVNPMQHYPDFSVVADRFVTFGLVSDYESSWSDVTKEYELGLIFKRNDGTEITGRVDISPYMREKPEGGLITIVLYNSKINHNTEGSGDGFNLDLNEWSSENIELII